MMELKSVSKKAIINMLIPAALTALIITAAALLIWFVFLAAVAMAGGVAWFYFGGLILVDLLLIISPFFRYYRYSYSIDDLRIVKKEGIFFVSTEIAPIERVHQITVSRGPIDNITGLAKVVAITAGGEIVIRFLEYHEAMRLAAALEDKIKFIVKEQAEHHEK